MSAMFRRSSRPTLMTRKPVNRFRKSPRSRLMLQALEDRAVPAALIVTDAGDTGGANQLRAMWETARTNAEADTITFDSAVTSVTLTSALSAYDELFDLTITGNGKAVTTINAAPSTRIFDFNVPGATQAITITNIKLNGGNTTVGYGGAILDDDETLVLTNVAFTANTAASGGGAVAVTTSSTTFTTLTITGCDFTTNTATSATQSSTTGGGAIYLGGNAAITINTSVFDGNRAVSGSSVFASSTITLNSDSSTFKNGRSTGTSARSGGAMFFNLGSTTVFLDNATVTGNSTAYRGGLLYVYQSGSSITVQNTTISSNTAVSGGGLYLFSPASSTFNNVAFTTNTATSGTGGGLRGAGPMSISSCTFSGNTSSGSGGAMYTSGASTITNTTFTNNRAGGSGGAISATTTVTLNNDTFTTNTATSTGGAISSSGALSVSSVTVSGNTSGSTGGALNLSGSTTITATTFSNNTGANNGGAIRHSSTMTLTNSTFSGNTSNGSLGGGAIYTAGGGLNASTVSFTNNRALNATGSGGGVRLASGASTIAFADFSGNTASAYGGGLSSGVATVISGTTFRGNTASNRGGGFNQASGGSATISNSTFSKNVGAGNAGGGAINANAAGTVVINNSTIYDNTASGSSTAGGGAGILRTGATAAITINSSIVAGNKITGAGTKGIDIFSVGGAATVGGNNSIIGTNDNSSVTFSGTGHQIGTDTAKLDPLTPNALADNGGVSIPVTGSSANIQTIALPAGSSAFDAGNNTAGLTTDQRGTGFTRTSGGVADVGAFEGVSARPSGALGSAPDITSAGNSTYSFDVVYSDPNSAIDTTTFDVNDVTVTGLGFGAGQNPTSFVASGNTVTYTIPAPAGGWGGTNIGAYTVTVNADQVSDTDTPTVNKTGLSPIGTFKTAFATTLLVDNTGDALDNNYGVGQLTFREALGLANVNAGFTDSVTFDATVFAAATTVTLTSGTGVLSDSVVVIGPAAALTFSANTTNQQITVLAGQTVTVSNLSFTKFSAASAGGVISLGANSSISLTNVSFTSNTSSSTGGGAIAVTGTNASITLNNDTFTTNSATTSGGAIHIGAASVTVNVAGSTFTGNTASSRGGAIGGNSSGTFAVSNSTFTGNRAASTGGGAMYFNSANTIGLTSVTLSTNTAASGAGGAIYMGTGNSLTVDSSTFSGNTSTSTGGAIRGSTTTTLNVTKSTFTGNTATSSGGVMYVTGSANVTISGSKLQGNTGSGSGGLYTSSSATVTIDSTLFGSNTGTLAGAVYHSSSATTTIDKSMFSGNTSGANGGGMNMASGGSLTVTDTTFKNNVSTSTVTTSGGGGLHTASASVTITNSTFNGNKAVDGGGMRVSSSTGSITVNNSTIAGNTATGGTGGISLASATTTVNTLSSTIVAANSGTVTADVNTVAGSSIAGDNNLIGVQGANWSASGTGNQIGTTGTPTNPGVNPIADNSGYVLLDGSFVQTMSLTATSLSRDNGNNSLALVYDQRGVGHARTIGTGTDVGAFEANANPIPIATGASNNVTTSGGTTFDVTVTFKDEVGVDVATIDVADVVVKTAFGGTTLNAVSFLATPNSGVVSPVTVTFTFNAPDNTTAGTWDPSDTDLYSVWLVGTVSDTDTPTVNSVASPQKLSTFTAALASKALNVDVTTDVDDGNYSAGNLSLREAVNFSNSNTTNVDSIGFDSIAFGAATTVTLDSALAVTDPVIITGTGSSSLTLSGNDTTQIFNVNLPSTDSVQMSGMTLAKGRGALGAAIGMTDDSLTLNNMVFSANTSTAQGGAISLTTGTLTVSNSSFLNNTATSSGGAIYGSSTCAITLINNTLSGNTGTTGGAVYISAGTLIVDPSILANNRGTNGSAIYVATSASSVTIDQSLITGNTSTSTHGAVYFFLGGDLTVTDSTFSNNTATTTGGAIANWSNNATITNSTFSGNTASSGGAIAVLSSAASITLENVTISGNTGSATAGVGGILTTSTVTVTTLNNTIVAANTGATTPDILTPTTTVNSIAGDFNLIGVQHSSWSATGTGNLIGTSTAPFDPGLNALADNGGFTLPDSSKIPTMSLKNSSQAVNLGPTTSALTNDQRGSGFPRIVDTNIDAGAFEAPISPIPRAKLLTAPDITSAGFAAETITIRYTDDVGIDTATLDNNDITVTGSGMGAGQKATFVSFTGSGTSVTATYTVAAPSGGWGGWNIGSYAIAINAAEVSDSATPTVNSVDAGSLGSFKTAFATTLVVDEESDVDDSDYTLGKRSFREALKLANGNNGLDTIGFDSSKFTGTPIVVATTLNITDQVTVNGPGAGKLVLDGNNSVQVMNINVPGSAQTVSLSGMTVTKGKAATGGNIQMFDDSVTISNASITFGSATTVGGGIALTTGTLTVSNSRILSNTSSGSGGAIYGSSTCAMTLNNNVISGNSGTTGGAIYLSSGTLDIDLSIIADNRGTSASAIYVANNASTVTIEQSLISGNSSSGSHGAIYMDFGGTLTVSDSTFKNNTASTSTGGAIAVWSSSTSPATTTITNSTFTGNRATNGGAIMIVTGPAVTTINNTTIAGNVATAGAGGIALGSSSSSLTLSSTIAATNTGTTTPDITTATGASISGDNNLIGVQHTSWTATGANNKIGDSTTPMDPLLNALADNDGFALPDGSKILTMALKTGSPALDAGLENGLLYDERGVGFDRKVGTAADIGAFEGIGVIPSSALTSAPTVTTVGATTYSFTVVYTDETGISTITIDKNDVQVSGGNYGSPVNADTFTITGNTGTSVTVSYTITPPGGAWDDLDTGTYTVSQVAGQVGDTDGTQHFVGGGPLGTFKVAIPVTYLVDEMSDTDDSITTAGNLSLREAIRLANTVSTGTIDIINFAGSVTGTLTMTGAEYVLTEGVTINGPGSGKLTIDAALGRRIFNDSTTQDTGISGLTLINGKVTGSGGAIIMTTGKLTLNDVTISGSTATSDGGGIEMSGAGFLIITNSTIQGNTAGLAATGSQGGGIDIRTGGHLRLINSTVSGNKAGEDGGGIYFFSGGSMLIDSSTISGNTADVAGTSTRGGGGIYWFGDETTGPDGFKGVKVVNSTISGNTALGSLGGGMVVLYADSTTVKVYNTTITNNVAATGGGFAQVKAGTATVYEFISSIVAGNSAATGPDMSFDVATNVAGDNNLIGVGDSNNFTLTGTGNQTGTTGLPLDAKLDVLGSNGGPTMTHALKAGSPALNAGLNPDTLSFDQRGSGFNRTSGASTDIGAYELQAAPPTVVSVQFGDGTAQRSMVTSMIVTFSEAVNFTGAVADAFTLFRSGTGGTTGNVTLTANPAVGPASSVTITFSGGLTQFNSLIDGLYDLTIDATKVSGAGGALDGDNDTVAGGNYAVIGNTTNKYFRLYGDGNGDGTVNQTDFIAFRNAFNNGPSMTWDFEGNGNVTQSDFTEFRNRFNLTP